MNRPTTHWHGTRSVSGPVDPDGCCADQPAIPTRSTLLADLNTEREARDTLRLAELLARWTLLIGAALLLPVLVMASVVSVR